MRLTCQVICHEHQRHSAQSCTAAHPKLPFQGAHLLRIPQKIRSRGRLGCTFSWLVNDYNKRKVSLVCMPRAGLMHYGRLLANQVSSAPDVHHTSLGRRSIHRSSDSPIAWVPVAGLRALISLLHSRASCAASGRWIHSVDAALLHCTASAYHAESKGPRNPSCNMDSKLCRDSKDRQYDDKGCKRAERYERCMRSAAPTQILKE